MFSVGFGSNNYGFNKWLLSRIRASNFGQNTDYTRVVSTHNICANCISINIAFLTAETFLRTVAPCGSEEINAFVTNNRTLFWLYGSFVWEYIRFRERWDPT